MLVLAMQFSRSWARDKGPRHEDAGAAKGPSRRSLEVERPEAAPSKQKTGQYVSLRFDRREEAPTTDGVTWTRPSEAPTGSRPCGVQEH